MHVSRAAIDRHLQLRAEFRRYGIHPVRPALLVAAIDSAPRPGDVVLDPRLARRLRELANS